MVTIGPPGVDPETPTAPLQPAPALPSLLSLQVDAPQSAPPEIIVDSQAKELRLPVALEQALAFKSERAKQVGVQPEELGNVWRFLSLLLLKASTFQN